MTLSVLLVDDDDAFRSLAVGMLGAAVVASEIAQLAGGPRVVLISGDADAAARRAGAMGFVAKEEFEGTRLRRLLDGS